MPDYLSGHKRQMNLQAIMSSITEGWIFCVFATTKINSFSLGDLTHHWFHTCLVSGMSPIAKWLFGGMTTDTPCFFFAFFYIDWVGTFLGYFGFGHF
jgi:hypothetical protein